MNKPHVHYKEMMQYAEDAAISETPWDNWEYACTGQADNWRPTTGAPSWSHHNIYRRKPKTIKVNGFDVPEPCKVALDNDKRYYFPAFQNSDLCDWYDWEGDNNDYYMLSVGIVHLTPEAAIIHAKAMLGIDPYKTDDEV